MKSTLDLPKQDKYSQGVGMKLSNKTYSLYKAQELSFPQLQETEKEELGLQLSGTVLAQHAQGPRFNPYYCQHN